MNIITEVTIINDDEPGEISFEDGKVILSELAGKSKIKVYRKNGSDGTIGSIKSLPEQQSRGRLSMC